MNAVLSRSLSPSSTESRRDLALDLVKGICVLVMVVHHSINYYPSEELTLRLFRFVSGAFVFMAGIVATQIYGLKAKQGASSVALGWRLILRGLKLLAIYTCINVALFQVSAKSAHSRGASLLEHMSRLYWTGDYTNTNFALLLPISYVLLVIGLLTFCPKVKAWAVSVLAFGSLVCCCWRHFDGSTGFFLRYISIGMLGAACGFLPNEVFRKYCGDFSGALLVYCCLLLVLTFLPGNYLLYLVNVTISFFFLYALGLKMDQNEKVAAALNLLGKYTLLAYLAQVAILQGTRLFMPRMGLGDWDLPAVILFASFVLLLGLYMLERLRRISAVVNRGYALIFM